VTATTSPASAAAVPLASDRPLHEVYDVALLDLDGVVYRGQGPVPGAPEALARAKAAGQHRAFVTNNASRSPAAIAAHLSRLGVPASAADVVTSAQAAARLLAEQLPAGARVLVVGGNGLRIALRERGLRPVSTSAEQPAAVVQGFSPDMSYGLLSEGVLAIRAGARYVASNADRTFPTARGAELGNGSLVAAIAYATGVQPVVAGKPETPLHAEAVERTGAKRPLVIGDRLDTDIEGAVNGGADSLLVLTGVTGPADVVLAPPHQRPSYLAADLNGLLEAHPEVTAAGDGWQCRGWTARASAGQPLELTGSGDAIDGLRAACAAVWQAGPGDRPDSADAVRQALSQLSLPS
jgi:glycerol 3-phosphatase-2